MIYTNPIISCDFSDPDAIRVGEDYFLVASSFSFCPGIPVLHSKNLVDYKIINYVYDKIPISGYNTVKYGFGAWAPSIRFHDGVYYCLIPFPDVGIFVSSTTDPFKKWSQPELLIERCGLEDPCPIWVEDKCYVVVAFAKSRIGFNSKLAVYEVDCNLKTCLDDDYTVIYDGTATQPTIEGPKCYKIGDYFYVLAPAGGVRYGWQVALRSKSIFGPFEEKIVLKQNDTDINGPHQGALVDTPDNKYAFLHFRDMGAYGRVLYLEPVEFIEGWPIIGNATSPVKYGEYPVKVAAENDYRTNNLNTLDSPEWQTPANKQDNFFVWNKDFIQLNCCNSGDERLCFLPQLLTQKIRYFSFEVKIEASLNLINEGDEAGCFVLGNDYAFLSVIRQGQVHILRLTAGTIGKEETVLYERSIPDVDIESVCFAINAQNVDADNFSYTFSFNGTIYDYKFNGAPLRWTGARVGVYAKGAKNGGYARIKKFEQIEKIEL